MGASVRSKLVVNVAALAGRVTQTASASTQSEPSKDVRTIARYHLGASAASANRARLHFVTCSSRSDVAGTSQQAQARKRQAPRAEQRVGNGVRQGSGAQPATSRADGVNDSGKCTQKPRRVERTEHQRRTEHARQAHASIRQRLELA